MRYILTSFACLLLLIAITLRIWNDVNISCSQLAENKSQLITENENSGGKVSGFNFVIKSLSNSLAVKLKFCS